MSTAAQSRCGDRAVSRHPAAPLAHRCRRFLCSSLAPTTVCKQIAQTAASQTTRMPAAWLGHSNCARPPDIVYQKA